MRVGDLDVISKDGGEPNFQTRYACQECLLCLVTRDPLFATGGKSPEFIETFVVSRANEPSSFGKQWAFVLQGQLQRLAQRLARIQEIPQVFCSGDIQLPNDRLNSGDLQ
jgi:hypothetical protein